jgi:hypothetical protein
MWYVTCFGRGAEQVGVAPVDFWCCASPGAELDYPDDSLYTAEARLHRR